MFSQWKSSRKAAIGDERSPEGSLRTHRETNSNDNTLARKLMTPHPSPSSVFSPFHFQSDSPVYLSLLEHLNDEEWSEIHEMIQDLNCSSMTKSQFTGLCTNVVMWVSEAASRIVLPALALVLDASITDSRAPSPESRSGDALLQATSGLLPTKDIVTKESIDGHHTIFATMLHPASSSAHLECLTTSPETYEDLTVSPEPHDQTPCSMSTQDIIVDSRATRLTFRLPSHGNFVKKWFQKRGTPAVSEVSTQTTPPFLREEIPDTASSYVSLHVEPHVDSAASDVTMDEAHRITESAHSSDNFNLGTETAVTGVSVTAANIVDMIMNEIFQDTAKMKKHTSLTSEPASESKFEKLLSTEAMCRLSPKLVDKVYRFIMEDNRTLPVRTVAARRIKSESSLPRVLESERLEQAREAFSELVYSFTERCLSQQLQECLRLQDRPRSEIPHSELSYPTTSIDMETSESKKSGFMSRFFDIHSKTKKNKVSPYPDYEDEDSNIGKGTLGTKHRSVPLGGVQSKIPLVTSSQSTSGSSCVTFASSKTSASVNRRKFRYILKFHKIHVSSEHLNFKATVQRRYTKRRTKSRPAGNLQSTTLPAQSDKSEEKLQGGSSSQSSFGSSWITIDTENATTPRSRIFGFLYKFFRIHPKTELDFKATVQRRSPKRRVIHRPGTLHRIVLAHRSEVTKGRLHRTNSSQSNSGSSWITVDSEDSNITRSRILRFLSQFFGSH
ncbi:transmembrane protein 101 isoform X1 [Arapaima gigas]